MALNKQKLLIGIGGGILLATMGMTLDFGGANATETKQEQIIQEQERVIDALEASQAPAPVTAENGPEIPTIDPAIATPVAVTQQAPATVVDAPAPPRRPDLPQPAPRPVTPEPFDECAFAGCVPDLPEGCFVFNNLTNTCEQWKDES